MVSPSESLDEGSKKKPPPPEVWPRRAGISDSRPQSRVFSACARTKMLQATPETADKPCFLTSSGRDTSATTPGCHVFFFFFPGGFELAISANGFGLLSPGHCRVHPARPQRRSGFQPQRQPGRAARDLWYQPSGSLRPRRGGRRCLRCALQHADPAAKLGEPPPVRIV